MAGPVYSFGPFRLEAHERRLLRDGSEVSLPGKAFDTLLLLVEGAGSLQRQQDLMDRLWPDSFVEPNNLQYNVSLIRRALEGADGRGAANGPRPGLPAGGGRTRGWERRRPSARR